MARKIIFWICTFAVIILLLIGLAKWGQKSSTTSTNTDVSIIKDTDWYKGDKASAVVLVEYSDFQCPACRNFEPTIKEVLAEYGDRMVLVYRHFPIYASHKNAKLAGQAAEAAGKQGKFWEYHDLVFEKQDEWKSLKDPASIFIEYAKSLSLDVTLFESDMNSDEAKHSVEDDANEGTRYGVNSTPTFYLNGVKLQLDSYDQLKNAIKTAVGA
ncbi:MAG: thioredoxin domain-containing protein [Patescibacteria group bacterium]